MRPDPGTIRQPQERGVTVEALPTGQAVRRFGELDPARATAALHSPTNPKIRKRRPVSEIQAGIGPDNRWAIRKAARRAICRGGIPWAREIHWPARVKATIYERLPVRGLNA